MMAYTLDEGAEFFTGLRMRIERARKEALTQSAGLIRDEAKRVIGTYDYGWPRLKPETIKHKIAGDTPLRETGELQASIQCSVDAEAGIATVGSNNPKALWHELGTSRVPPRSFLAGAAVAKTPEVLKICGADLFGWAVTSRVPEDKG